MSYNDYGFNPNEIDSDQFLSEMPVSLMKENIKVQFANPMEHRKKDHISTFISMYRYSKTNINVYEDEDLDNVYELKDDFYAFMQQMFETYLGVGIVDFDDMSEFNQHDMIHYIYRFFIINIKKNFICLIMNYIENQKSSYVEDDKKKDVTTMSLKKEISDPVDVYILSNLNEIINDALSYNYDVDEFFLNCDTDDPCLETRFMMKHYDDFSITGNFVEKYIQMIDTDFKSSIESKIRNTILKKYKK